MEVFNSNSVERTYEIGREIAGKLDLGDCVALVGDLGAGKTTITKGLAEGLGLDDSRMVSSPTFVLVQEYPGKVPLYHIDLYRLTAPAEELLDLGFDEMLETGVVLIEWADRAESALPRPYWELRIEISGEHSRRFLLRQVD
ncbi:MAG: tRNA (adenosine(37)-N6)-threonylcarbamoyltransferase complex ATPase subunit type 1 TsaE [Phycisphaerae bacterium]